MTNDTDIVKRLRARCVGHPNAKIPWPHYELHEAADLIEKQRAEIEDLQSACTYYRELIATAAKGAKLIQ